MNNLAILLEVFVGGRKIDGRHDIGMFSTSLSGLAVERVFRVLYNEGCSRSRFNVRFKVHVATRFGTSQLDVKVRQARRMPPETSL